MYVCMYVCMYVHIYIYICISKYILYIANLLDLHASVVCLGSHAPRC